MNFMSSIAAVLTKLETMCRKLCCSHGFSPLWQVIIRGKPCDYMVNYLLTIYIPVSVLGL